MINKNVFKLIRVFFDLTQAQMAKRLGCSRSLVASVETGYRKITPKMAAKLRQSFYLHEKTIDQLSAVAKDDDHER